jgi:hypothetical protein
MAKKGLRTLAMQAILPPNIIPLSDYQAIFKQYVAYKKLSSMASLAARRLPILQGFAIPYVNEEVLEFLKHWMHLHYMKRLSVRFDSTNAADNKRLLGSNPTLEEFTYMAQNILHSPVIAIVMKENDRFQQGYSILSSFLEDKIVCEIVGPGFDASDLTRGQITPHEIIAIWRQGSTQTQIYEDTNNTLMPGNIIYHQITSAESYQKSIEARYSKIFNIIQSGLGYAVKTNKITSQGITVVDRFLQQRQSTLLTHKDNYIPIGYEKLSTLYAYLWELDLFDAEFIANKVVSASFLLHNNLIFWDIFGDKKYEQYVQ